MHYIHFLLLTTNYYGVNGLPENLIPLTNSKIMIIVHKHWVVLVYKSLNRISNLISELHIKITK